MKRQENAENQAILDKNRQANKGKAGYDKNGYPIAKTMKGIMKIVKKK